MSAQTQKKLAHILTWILLLVPVLPLLYFQGFFFPFITLKLFYFKTLIEFGVAIFLVLLACGYSSLRLDMVKRKIAWVPAVFLGVAYLSSYIGVDFYHSFWSTFERGEGLVTLTHVIAYFYLLLFVFGEKEWNTFWKTTVGVSAIVSLYALGQKMNLPGLVHSGATRLEGTIGSSSFLATYLLMTSFLSLYIWHKEKKGNMLSRAWHRLTGSGNGVYNIWGVIALFEIAILFMTGTRGAILAFFAVVLVALAVFSVKGETTILRKGSLGLLVFFIVIGSLGILNREALKQSDIQFVSRLGSISLQDGSTKNRLFAWGVAVDGFKEQPLLGHGQESFEYVYNKAYDPQETTEQWFDRSHNVYLDYLVQYGIIGFGLFAAMLYFLLQAVWAMRKRDLWGAVILGLLLVGYYLQNLFVFDTINSSFLFYAILAFFIFETTASKETSHTSLSSIGRYAVGVLAIGVLVSWYWVNYLPVRANLALQEGYKYQVVDPERSLEAFQKGLSYNTFGDWEYAPQMREVFFHQKEFVPDSIPLEEHVAFFTYATDVLKKVIEKHPYNVRPYIYLSEMYNEPPEGVEIDPEEFAALLDSATPLSPLRPNVYYARANILIRKGQDAKNESDKQTYFSEASDLLVQYADRVPEFAEGSLIAANVLLQSGEEEQAQTYLEKGIAAYEKGPNDDLARRIIQFYVREKDYEHALPYFEYISKNNPENYDYLFDLAHIYYFTNRINEAVDALNILTKESPEILERDPLFKENVLLQYQVQNNVRVEGLE